MKKQDVCPLDFPPVSYGHSLAEVEQTVQTVLETTFRDESGLLLSGVNGRTMKPLRPEDVTERHYGLGGGWENMSIPKEYKNVGMNFENCHQSSGKYLDGLVDKYAVTGDPDVLGYARQIVNCARDLWEIVGKTHRYGKGWMPKPFAGMNELDKMDDSSVDQYADLTFGLEKYCNELATPEERDVLEEMFLSFADWWIDHNYTTSYSGSTVWWDRVHTLSQAYFLYLFELAYSISPRRRFRDAFDYVFSRAEEELTSKEGPLTGCNYSPNTAGIVVEGMARMAVINPRLERFANRVIRNYAGPMIKAAVEGNSCTKDCPIFNLDLFGAKYLAHCHDALQDESFVETMVDLLTKHSDRQVFYHIRRGIPLDYEPLQRLMCDKDDYRDVFWSEQHSCWIAAYWYLRRHGKVTADQ